MTIKELIQELSKHPQATRVVVSGYEDGYDDVSRLISTMIVPTPKANPYEGSFETAKTGEPAVVIYGRSRDGDE